MNMLEDDFFHNTRRLEIVEKFCNMLELFSNHLFFLGSRLAVNGASEKGDIQ